MMIGLPVPIGNSNPLALFHSWFHPQDLQVLVHRLSNCEKDQQDEPLAMSAFFL